MYVVVGGNRFSAFFEWLASMYVVCTKYTFHSFNKKVECKIASPLLLVTCQKPQPPAVFLKIVRKVDISVNM